MSVSIVERGIGEGSADGCKGNMFAMGVRFDGVNRYNS